MIAALFSSTPLPKHREQIDTFTIVVVPFFSPRNDFALMPMAIFAVGFGALGKMSPTVVS